MELWDVSGSSRYQATWPALAWELHGIIFVFDPNIDSHSDDLNMYYEQFCKKARCCSKIRKKGQFVGRLK